ncbi:MAG: hypothetical protein J0I07_41915 [Myxococcales bacterium]|nr:hypothetical protein [Myxococcales bacterium]
MESRFYVGNLPDDVSAESRTVQAALQRLRTGRMRAADAERTLAKEKALR